MGKIHTCFLGAGIGYDGSQLCEGWAAAQAGTPPGRPLLVAFLGPCDVAREHMVDVEDLDQGARIWSEEMVHFLLEEPGADLAKAVLHQRLLVIIAAEVLGRLAPAKGLERRGDDLYDGARKLSISVATVSPHSNLVHLALNVRPADDPVPTQGLAAYGVEPRLFAEHVLGKYAEERAAMEHACGKVRPVGRWKGRARE